MILLVNSIGDTSSHKFMELCNFKKINYFQIEDEQEVTFDNIHVENGELKDFTIINKTSGKSISKNAISGFFYRKGRISPNLYLDFYPNVNDSIKNEFMECLTDEWNALVFYIFDWIENNVPTIGSYNNTVPNKMQMLHIASKCGFTAPYTYILSNKELINNFYKSTPCITKSIQDIIVFEYENCVYRSYTSQVEELTNNSYSLFPSLMQKKINSKYEIRIFYFDKNIYSIAIAHDKVKEMKVDYRNSETFPDVFPYSLTKQNEKKLRKFIQNCGYNSGSIDLLLSDENELFFLEINPVGQFDFVSDFCGKNIEIDIINFFYNKLKPNVIWTT